MTRPVTRRQLLGWMLKGAATTGALFQIPAGILRHIGKGIQRRRHSVHIPFRPFNRSDLRRPHDLAG